MACVLSRLSILFFACWLVVFVAPRAVAQQPALGTGSTQLDLKSQLEKGLKARRPVEFAYIAAIVKLVDQGRLPRSMVTSTFALARTRSTRQLQYFQMALAARARKLNVALPNLANQTVGFQSFTR